MSIIILAVICIGGVELAACRIFAPELYLQITAPLQAGIAAVSALGRQAESFLTGLFTSSGEGQSTPGSQLASDPTVSAPPPVSDPSVTELKTADGREILTGGVVETVYFNQSQQPWASQPYGSDNIAGYGCGPTAMSMVISSLTSTEIDPAVMAQWAVDNGHWAKGSGSYYSIVPAAASAFGLSAESLPDHTVQAVQEALLSGKLLVALMDPGHFTSGGHFILLRGVTLSGELLVADPNSVERSLATWDPQLVLDELSSSTGSGAPLWVISQTAQ